MTIKIVKEKISLQEVEELAQEFYKEMVKGVADIEKGIIALGGEWHMDANEVLITDGSEQKDLWGFNIYWGKPKTERLEYNSLINIRPSQDNRGMEIENDDIKQKIFEIVNNLIG